ncbi:MAG: phosphatase PAP2 family protein [Nocardioidaceae bacterium]|nr:phosphatase PAP2 family protein [Nocardioidaceae bacterium]
MSPDTSGLVTAAPSVVAPDVEQDHWWLWRVWAVVAAFALMTAAWSRHVGISVRDPHGSILLGRIALSLGLLVVLAVVDAGARSWRAGLGVRGAVMKLRARWTWRRTALVLAALLAYHLIYFCYHNLKSWDVFNPVRDSLLLQWDRWLFLGHSPAVLLHQALGQHMAAYVLMVIYESFSTLVSVSVVASVVFTERVRDGYVFITSAIYVWILGVGSYYLIPSLGPFHSAPQEFARLPHTMIQDTQARYMGQRAYLLAHPQAHDAFAQVSAFASLHVAVTCLILLMARYYRLRIISWVLAAFLVATIVATVYLGWHFFVDDIAGLAIAVLGVTLGRLTTYPRGRPTASDGRDAATS